MGKKYLIGFICLIIFLIVIFVNVTKYSKSTDNINAKIEEQISYIQNKLLVMLNSLNNISFEQANLSEEKAKKSNNEQSSSKTSEGSDSSNTLSDSSKSSDSLGGSTTSDSTTSSSGKNTGEEFSKYTVNKKNILTNTDTSIDWDYIKNTTENLYATWTNIMVDLHSVNIKNDDILNFSNNLDILIVNVQNESKLQTLNTLAILYAFIPKYIEQYSKDTEKINIAYTESYLVNAYALLEESRWEDMKSQINKAQEHYNIIINSVNDNNNQNKLSKAYVLLNETNNAINLKDKKLYYIKYINLMEALMKI